MNAVLIAGLLAGCSDSKPDSDNIASALKGEFGDVIKVGEIERIDGVAYPGGAGIPESYKMEFKATLLAPGPVTLRLSNKKGEEARVKSIVAGHEPLSQGPHRWRTDETRPAIVTGAIQFVKAESGWRAGGTTVFLTEDLMRAGSMPPPERFERIAEGIRDNEQQLIWTDRDNGSNVNWNAANQYCAALGVGWSLPSRDVLRSLSDPDRNNKYPQTWTYRGNVKELWIATPLIKLSSSSFWSSEHVVRSSILAWKMSFIERGNENSWRADQAVARALCIKVLENIEPNNPVSEPSPVSTDRFTAAGNSVSDAQTGLIWAAQDNGSDIDWNAAGNYCATLGAGWVLPTVLELQGLYGAMGSLTQSCGELTCKVTPAIRLSSFWFWSDEPIGSSEAWSVGLESGGRASSAVDSANGGRALCVQRSQLINNMASGRFEKTSDGIHDSAQKLIWAEKDSGSTKDWVGAKAYCESLGTGWKLPSVVALQSLYDASGKYTFLWTQDGSEPTETELGPNYLNVNPATPLIKLSDVRFWSNEASESTNAWMVDLGSGEKVSNPTDYADGAHALCARSGL